MTNSISSSQYIAQDIFATLAQPIQAFDQQSITNIDSFTSVTGNATLQSILTNENSLTTTYINLLERDIALIPQTAKRFAEHDLLEVTGDQVLPIATTRPVASMMKPVQASSTRPLTKPVQNNPSTEKPMTRPVSGMSKPVGKEINQPSTKPNSTNFDPNDLDHSEN